MSMLVRMYAKTTEKSVLAVAFRNQELCLILHFRGDTALQLSKFPRDRELGDFVTKWIANQKYDLVLYDGLHQSIEASQGVVGVFKNENVFPKVAYVISLPFELRDGENLPDYKRNYEEDFFNSWTRQDFLDTVQALRKAGYLHAAITNDIADFRARHANGLDDDDADGLDKKLDAKADNVPISMSSIHSYVDFKYFYAGGSIRFMLDYILDRLKAKLSILIDSVMTNHHSKAFASQAILYGTNDTYIFSHAAIH